MKKGQEPAFPQPIDVDLSGDVAFSSQHGEEFAGISTRLYIATKAMQGIASSIQNTYNINDELAKQIAEESFRLADALLEEEKL